MQKQCNDGDVMEDEINEVPNVHDMELRDYFAAKVLAQNHRVLTKWAAAAQAYEYADAMLLARALIPHRAPQKVEE
jgi:hypothetical protein